MIMSASEFLVTSVVIMGIIVIGIIAYSFDLFMRWIERRRSCPGKDASDAKREQSAGSDWNRRFFMCMTSPR